MVKRPIWYQAVEMCLLVSLGEGEDGQRGEGVRKGRLEESGGEVE